MMKPLFSLCPDGPDSATVEGPEAVEVTDPIKITCTAASIPPANITWKFNDTVLSVKSAEYIIERAEYKNSGTYTCEMRNSITGKMATKSHVLSVKGELHVCSLDCVAV